MRINRLGGDDKFAQILREIRQVQQAAMLGKTSVHNGRTRFVGEDSWRLEGSGTVSGTLNISGTLKGVGSLIWDSVVTFTSTFTAKGVTRFEGDTTQVGAHHVRGNQDITGTLAVKGKATLENDLTIAAGGRVIVGLVTIDPGAGGSGGLSSASYIRMATPILWASKDVYAEQDVTAVRDVLAYGKVITPNAAPASGSANVFLNASGTIQRIGSARRFKIDPQPMPVPAALLEVPVKEWIDLGNAERFSSLYLAPRPFTRAQQLDYDGVTLARVPGVIAEEVEAVGGERFVTYDSNGIVEGVAYDRLAIARTQILADQFRELRRELAQLRELLPVK